MTIRTAYYIYNLVWKKLEQKHILYKSAELKLSEGSEDGRVWAEDWVRVNGKGYLAARKALDEFGECRLETKSAPLSDETRHYLRSIIQDNLNKTKELYSVALHDKQYVLSSDYDQETKTRFECEYELKLEELIEAETVLDEFDNFQQ